MPDILVDSNILVYAHDPRDARKQEQATGLLNHLISEGLVVLSVQCLSEFFNAVTNKLPERVSVEDALTQIDRFVQSCRIFDLTVGAVLEGCRAASQHSLSVWDALIWAVAKLNQVPYVLTEDMQHGRFLEGVRFQNPFVAEFDLGQLTQV